MLVSRGLQHLGFLTVHHSHNAAPGDCCDSRWKLLAHGNEGICLEFWIARSLPAGTLTSKFSAYRHQ
jgi:hypothetical protein